MLSAGLDHARGRVVLGQEFGLHLHIGGLICVPCVNSPMLEARGTEQTKAHDGNRSVGWTLTFYGGLDQILRGGGI